MAARPGHVPELFGDSLDRQVAERRSQLVLGLDPDPGRLWPGAIETAASSTDQAAPVALRAARAVVAHCAMAIEATAEHCVAVKLQVACFERLGAPGWTALSEVGELARRHQLLVIADAKRGDIDVSATAYGEAFFGTTSTPFGELPGLGVDALTVNPLLGLDSLRPLVDAARSRGAGVFVLVRTSNPGAADVQERRLVDGAKVSGLLAALVNQAGDGGIGAGGLADVGAVVGATAPEQLGELRAQMPHAVFLLPGVGAQGGKVQDLAAAFSPGPAGGLIAVSRGLVQAYHQTGGDPAQAAAEQAARLRRLAWELGG